MSTAPPLQGTTGTPASSNATTLASALAVTVNSNATSTPSRHPGSIDRAMPRPRVVGSIAETRRCPRSRAAASTVDAWSMPFGDVPLDRELIERIAGSTEVELDDPAAEPPHELLDRARPLLGGRPVVEVARLRSHRRRAALLDAAGARVESIRNNAANTYAGEFFCVVEGAIPTADGGIYGMVGGHTMLQIAQEICPKARAVIAIGTCGSYGGLAAASPNPTGAKGVKDALGSQLQVPVVNIPGCPPNPITFVGTLAHYLLPDKPLTLDSLGRPTFAYGARVHDQCPYRHDSQEHRCLEDYGCKGKRCHNNCPTEQFNDKTSWPVLAGHPCIGCSEPNFWDTMTPFYQEDEEHEEHDSYGGSGEYSREEEYDD